MKIEQIRNERHASRPFKYCNAWANHPDFIPRVEVIWQEHFEGCIMLHVVKKLKLLKQSLKELNRQHFINILTEVAEDKEALVSAQLALQNNPIDQELQEHKRSMFQRYKKSSYLVEMFLQQISKVNWIKLGDDNTKYF